MKRRLSNTYKNLVDYIENGDEGLADFLTEMIEEGCKKFPNRDNKLWRIIEDLYITPLEDFELGELTKTIVDIFEGNYELEEPSCYWKFKELRGFDRCDLYFGTTFDDEPLLVDISDCGTAKKCTKTEFNNFLSHTQTNLTIDNFTPVEEIEK